MLWILVLYGQARSHEGNPFMQSLHLIPALGLFAFGCYLLVKLTKRWSACNWRDRIGYVLAILFM